MLLLRWSATWRQLDIPLSELRDNYDAADPENRLVTGELERLWNQALQRVREIENRIQLATAEEQHTAPTPAEFAGFAEQLDQVWNDPRSDASLKKRIVRTLIQDVVATWRAVLVRSYS